MRNRTHFLLAVVRTARWGRFGRQAAALWVQGATLILALVFFCLATPAAPAQSFYDPLLNSRDVDAICEALHYRTQAQRFGVAALYEGLVAQTREKSIPRAEFRAKVDQAVEEFRSMKSSPTLFPPEAIAQKKAEIDRLQAEESKLTYAFQVERWKITDAFVVDLQAILTPEERETLWPRAERAMRRSQLRKIAGTDFTAWRSLDLGQLVGDLALGDAEKALLAPQVEAWEVEVDGPLRDFRRMIRADVLGEKSIDTMEGVYEIGDRISHINREHVKLLCAALPEPSAHALIAAVHCRVYPLFATERLGGKALTAASKLKSLSADQRDLIEGIKVRYERESKVLDTQVVERSDASQTEFRAFALLPEATFWDLIKKGQDPRQRQVEEFQSARDSLEQRIEKELDAKLTTDQRAEIGLKKP